MKEWEGSPKVTIYFDGGFLWKTSRAYGSYEVRAVCPRCCLVPLKASRVDLMEANNQHEAEYMILIAALKRLQPIAPTSCKVTVYTDSQTVCLQLTANCRNRTERLTTLMIRARELLKRYRHWNIKWVPRIENVRRFGH